MKPNNELRSSNKKGIDVIVDKEYTTESRVVDFCLRHIDGDGECNKAFKPFKFRPDFVSHAKKIAVEFDGYQHYTNPETIVRDMDKDGQLSSLKYKVVRIPYFVQLTDDVITHLFYGYSDDAALGSGVQYPHGFIDDKAALPAHFCSLGVERFKMDLGKYSFIRDDILQSLKRREALMDQRLIYPHGWCNI